MRARRRLVSCCTLLVALAATPRGASAQLLIVADGAEPGAIAHAELAYAEGDGPPVTWLALRLARGPVAVVAALPEAAHAEPALDAWFAAVERSSSPNVLPPSNAVACVDRPGYVHVGWPRGPGAPGSELDLRSREDVATALEDQGLPAPGELPEAEHYAVWWWSGGDAEETTQTLRIVGAGAPLELLPGAELPVLVSSVTPGPQRRLDESMNDALSVTFGRGPGTDYGQQLRGYLAEHDGSLLEARSRGVLFDWSILGNLVSLPPLADGYARAAARELSIDAEECARQLRGLESADAPGAEACGDARDYELALQAAGAENATLQRWAVSGRLGYAPRLARAGGEPRLPLLRAARYGGPACADEAPAPIVSEPPRAGPGVGGGSTPVIVEEPVVETQGGSGDVGCGTSPGRDPYYDDRDTLTCSSDTSSSNDDACSGDSSSSSGSDDTCSGDSSSSSESDDACSGDSSSSSSDDGCASDSSSSSDDAGCDGGGERHDYDGDTCTGSAAPRSSRSQQLEAARPRRVKTSLWSLAFVALALPIRRRKRRKI